MIGLLVDKSEYYYTARWISKDNPSKYGFFKFKIVKDDDTRKGSVENLSGNYGNATWETKSGLDFQPEDVVYFRGQKFHIVVVDASRKIEGEQAFIWFKNNGNIPVTLQVRKAG